VLLGWTDGQEGEIQNQISPLGLGEDGGARRDRVDFRSGGLHPTRMHKRSVGWTCYILTTTGGPSLATMMTRMRQHRLKWASGLDPTGDELIREGEELVGLGEVQ
jgi:hypothetical protein